MDPRRIVVATSPVNVGKASEAPLVGLFEWTSPEPWCAVIVKSRVSSTDAKTMLRPKALLARNPQADALRRPVDFVPMKELVDVILVGNVAVGRSAPPNQPFRAHAKLKLAGVETAFELSADRPGRVPLSRPSLRLVQSDDESDVGPRNVYDGADRGFMHRAKFPWETAQAGHPLLFREEVPEGARVTLELMMPKSSDKELAFDFELPSVTPQILIDPSQAGRDEFDVAMRLDTIVVDADTSAVELIWRGMFETYTGVGDVNRMTLGWATEDSMADPEQAWPSILRELPHGEFHYVWYFRDAAAGVPPPALTAKELKVERMRTWTYPLSPEPRIDIEELARLQARLAERREPRAETLKRFNLDEDRFAIEQRAWMERVGEQARVTGGRPPLDKRYTTALRQSRETGTSAEEIARSLPKYASITSRMKGGQRARVLKDEQLSLSEWLRWDGRVARHAAKDPDVAKKLKALLEGSQ